MGASYGLLFGGGVPPGIEDEDVVGGGEVEASAAGFDGDQERLYLGVRLKFFDFFHPFVRSQVASEPGELLFALLKFLAEKAKVLHKGAKKQRLVVTAADGVPLLQDVIELATFLGVFLRNQAWVIHQLAQFGQRLQHQNAVLRAVRVVVFQQKIPGCAFLPLVQFLLLRGHFGVENLSRKWRQVLSHFLLGASQHIRGNQVAQA